MRHFQARGVCSASTVLSVSIALEHSRGDDKRIVGGTPRASSEIINY